MKKTIITIILAIVAAVAIVWASSIDVLGLAWIPGYLIALICIFGILEIHDSSSNK